MGARENRVERYLHEQVEAIGGTTRKWVSPGRDGVPDRIVIVEGNIFFVEVKTIDGELSKVQQREIDRLELHGAVCYVTRGNEGVDAFIRVIQEFYL